MKCPNCGEKLEDTALFCTACAARQNVPEKSNGKKIGMIAIIAVALVAVAVILGGVFTHGFGLLGKNGPVVNDAAQVDATQFTNKIQDILDRNGYPDALPREIKAYALNTQNGKSQYAVIAHNILDEGVINYDHPFFTSKNFLNKTDCSFAMLFLFDGDKVTILKEFYQETYDTAVFGCKISFYDLNGDGKSEIVVNILFYEGSNLAVFENQQGLFVPVLGGSYGP